MKLVEETCGFQNVQLPCSSEFISLAEIIMSGENGLMGYQCKKRQTSLYRVIGEDKEVADNLQGSHFHQSESMWKRKVVYRPTCSLPSYEEHFPA